MTKFKETGYDDKKANEAPDFAPSFGAFNAVISAVTSPKKDEAIVMKTAKNGVPFYSARVEFTYKNAKGEQKSQSSFFNFGIWFPDEMKYFLHAIKADNKKDREAMMMDTDHLIGRKCDIVIGAVQPTYKAEEKELFEGYEVGEYDNKRHVRNNIKLICATGQGASNFDEEFEKGIRERFKAGQPQAQEGDVDNTDPVNWDKGSNSPESVSADGF